MRGALTCWRSVTSIIVVWQKTWKFMLTPLLAPWRFRLPTNRSLCGTSITSDADKTHPVSRTSNSHFHGHSSVPFLRKWQHDATPGARAKFSRTFRTQKSENR